MAREGAVSLKLFLPGIAGLPKVGSGGDRWLQKKEGARKRGEKEATATEEVQGIQREPRDSRPCQVPREETRASPGVEKA